MKLNARPADGTHRCQRTCPGAASDFNYFDAESFVDVARSMLPSREKGDGLYAVEVQGDSMIDAMITMAIS